MCDNSVSEGISNELKVGFRQHLKIKHTKKSETSRYPGPGGKVEGL